MLKLIKHLKPFILPLLLAVGLLYGQAVTDLALPDYMSDIVNTGIQGNGIESTIPEVMTLEDLDHLKLVLSEADYQLVSDQYQVIPSDSPDAKTLVIDYPKLEGASFVRVKALTKEETPALELVMAKGLLTLTGIETTMTENAGKPIKLGEIELPAGTNLFDVMGQMPADKRVEFLKDANTRFETMGDKMTVQAGASAVKTKYMALGVDTDALQSQYILRIGGIMMLITLTGAVASIAVGFIASRVAAGLGKNLRKKIFDKVSNFSFKEFDTFSTASLITRSTNDVTQIQNLMVMMIRFLVYAPIIGFGGVLKAMEKSNSMSWIIALAVLVLLGLIAVIFSIALPKFKLIQKLVDRLNMVTRENLTGMMVIRAFNTQAFEEKRFEKANQDLTANNLYVNRVMVFMMPMMMLIMNGVTLLIVWVGAHQIAEANMQVGDMMAFMQYAMQIIMAFLMLSMMFIMIPRASVAAGRIAEVLEVVPTINDPASPKVLDPNGKGTVEFKDVCFKYVGAEQNVVKNITFTAHAGQTTAIIGATGSGKTTLVNLIPRFYDVTCGEILIDGVDIRDVKQADIRDLIGYVPQKASLFSGTIESNLKYGKDHATEAELLKAAEIAQAMEIIEEKEEGLKAAISQGGTNLSGGQKQRLSIGRALAKQPKIYIFDDSFSALDFKTDANLRKALKAETGHSTVLIIGQRVATIKNADQIIVMDEGQIVGIGTHDSLMKTCDVYQEIAYSQLSKEELA